jgi:hypothetical protein
MDTVRAAVTGRIEMPGQSSDVDSPASAGTNENASVSTAWNIHSALADWTGKVDVKASIALSTELALVTAVVTALSSRFELIRPDGAFTLATLYLGVGLLMSGAFLAIAAVIPRLGRTGRPQRNFVYFGSLRHWQAEELQVALRETDPLEMLSVQLVAMSRIVWRKHLLVLCSLTVSALGLTLVALVAMLSL